MDEKKNTSTPLWILSVLLMAAGSAVYFILPSYSFSGLILLGLGALAACYGLIGLLSAYALSTAKVLRILLTLCVCLGLLAAIITGVYIWDAGLGDPDAGCGYVIVLGAGVNGTTPSLSLRQRINAAYGYLDSHPDAVCVASGGQGSNEDISEASCIARELIKMGISPDRIWLEEQSTSTKENLMFSLALIEEKTGSRPAEICIASSEYHLFRAELMAKSLGLTPYGIPADSQWFFLRLNYHLREIVAVWAFLLFG